MADGDLPWPDHRRNDLFKPYGNEKQKEFADFNDNIKAALKICRKLREKRGVHTVNHMVAAGFEYTGDGDVAKCTHCGIQLSDWVIYKDPFDVHAQENPDCPFVHFIKSSPPSSNALGTINSTRRNYSSHGQQIDSIESERPISILKPDLTPKSGQCNFSDWPSPVTRSEQQGIEEGSFHRNTDDLVMFQPFANDQCKVHNTISPDCSNVNKKLSHSQTRPIHTINNSLARIYSGNNPVMSKDQQTLQLIEIVFTAACNPAYPELPKRHASFVTWPQENLPPVDDLVRAGFFYTGTKTIVTCFYCNGSLQNWRSNDNPMIQHAYWFPHCTYAKQLCGDEMYRKIQESKRAQLGKLNKSQRSFEHSFSFLFRTYASK